MSDDSKKFGGYEPKIFTQAVNKDFICSICNLFVRHPKECSFCGTLYCSSCLSQWVLPVFPNGKKKIKIIYMNAPCVVQNQPKVKA